MTTFTHIHASGRYDKSPSTLESAIDSYILKGAKLITGTEVSRETREQALRDVAQKQGFSVITGDKGGMDDSFVMWDDELFDKVAAGTHILSGYTYDAKGGGIVYAAWAVLTNGHKRLLVMSAHQASGVEREGGLTGAISRVRKWRKDTQALKEVWNHLADKYDVTAILITCDWNVNIKRLIFRALFKRKYPGMRLILNPKDWPNKGTLGKRLIDFSFIRGRISGKNVRVLNLNASSDHRPFKQTIELT